MNRFSKLINTLLIFSLSFLFTLSLEADDSSDSSCYRRRFEKPPTLEGGKEDGGGGGSKGGKNRKKKKKSGDMKPHPGIDQHVHETLSTNGNLLHTSYGGVFDIQPAWDKSVNLNLLHYGGREPSLAEDLQRGYASTPHVYLEASGLTSDNLAPELPQSIEVKNHPFILAYEPSGDSPKPVSQILSGWERKQIYLSESLKAIPDTADDVWYRVASGVRNAQIWYGSARYELGLSSDPIVLAVDPSQPWYAPWEPTYITEEMTGEANRQLSLDAIFTGVALYIGGGPTLAARESGITFLGAGISKFRDDFAEKFGSQFLKEAEQSIRAILRKANRYLSDSDLDDLTQEALLKVASVAERTGMVDAFGKLPKVTLNTFIDWYRKEKRRGDRLVEGALDKGIPALKLLADDLVEPLELLIQYRQRIAESLDQAASAAAKKRIGNYLDFLDELLKFPAANMAAGDKVKFSVDLLVQALKPSRRTTERHLEKFMREFVEGILGRKGFNLRG